MNSVERVKAICKERKIPISRLEKELGYSNGYIGQLRKGIFPADRLKEIAKYLGVSTDYLMTGEETDIESKVDYVLRLENGEMALLEDYRSLPDPFKLKARTYVETLTRLHSMEQPLLNAAHAIENASSEDKQYDEDIMDDENF